MYYNKIMESFLLTVSPKNVYDRQKGTNLVFKTTDYVTHLRIDYQLCDKSNP